MPYIVRHRKMALFVAADDGITTTEAEARQFGDIVEAAKHLPPDFATRFTIVPVDAVPARPEIEQAEPDMFAEAEEQERLKREGMAQAELHATQRWTQKAYDAVVFVSGLMPDFTASDVWRALKDGGHDIVETERNPTAMGAVMARVARDRLITPTGEYRPTGHHNRPQMVWRKATTQEYRSA